MKKLSQADKVGVYVTVIIHLTVIVILLLTSIGGAIFVGDRFVIDFSQPEQKPPEAKKKEEEKTFKEKIDERIEDLLSGRRVIKVKNIATDRSALKDDRGTDAQKLYEDAAKLAKELKEGYKVEEDKDNYVATRKTDPVNKAASREYSGPSVVSYELSGRKASHLPIPAYKCIGGGLVTILITVNNAGVVVDARVQEETSSADKCLREFALRAAKMSRFSSSATSPSKQAGNIVYQFIAQ